jgi:hypothetical protein
MIGDWRKKKEVLHNLYTLLNIISLLSFLKGGGKYAYEITFLTVCCPLYQHVNQFVDFHRIQYRCQAIESDLNDIIFNPIASTIPKWHTFRLLKWMQNLHQSTWDHETLYSDRSSKMNNFL